MHKRQLAYSREMPIHSEADEEMGPPRAKKALREIPLPGGVVVQQGDTVELRFRHGPDKGFGNWSGDFLKIASMSSSPVTGAIVLRGWSLMRRMFMEKLNDGKSPQTPPLASARSMIC